MICLWYVSYAALATVGTWLLTALGASTVFFFTKTNPRVLSLMLGFSAGIMLAASYFSLLAPALEAAQGPLPAFVSVTLGFLAGGLFLIGCDLWFSRRHARRTSRVFLLISSITLHNIPEGLAVGVAFGVLRGTLPTASTLAAPVAVAVGIGLQNFPEGAAVALPLRQEGHSRFKSFMLGQLSGIVEPIAGVLGALLVTVV
ncbi:MAG: ZIP family metal transporter, partial [Clostridia bacterium]|nr:ZIP family metal transporter [Clostridia bacterium]